MSLVVEFEKLIDPDWRLPRVGGSWQVNEPGSTHSLLEVGGCASYGFSLDHKVKDRFPFFRESCQRGMRKANDAIVVAEIDGEFFVAAIEMKTKISDKSDALKQIESGRFFMQWIDKLFDWHGHWSGNFRFFGIVSLKPRRQVRKGVSRRSAATPKPERHISGYQYFVLRNHPKVFLPDLIKSLGATS